MTTENWAVQVSVKLPHDPNDNYRDTLVNVRAETTEQLKSIMGWLEENAATLASSIQTVRAAATVGTVFAGPGTTVVPTEQPPQQAPGQWAAPQGGPPPQWAPQPQQQQYQQAPPQAPQAPAGPGPLCAHGPMEWKQGTGKTSGKAYKGWFCPSRNRQQQCDPQFVY